jgi:hypothetical protein
LGTTKVARKFRLLFPLLRICRYSFWQNRGGALFLVTFSQTHLSPWLRPKGFILHFLTNFHLNNAPTDKK